MLKREDLKVGDVVVCVKEGHRDFNIGDRVVIDDFMLKWWDGFILTVFEKVDESPIKTLSFEGLLDLTVEAYKAGVINFMSIEHDVVSRIGITFTGGYRWFKSNKPECFEEYADFIDSLYKETFVIESDSDIAKIKYGAEVELSNGSIGIAVVTAKASDMNVVKVEYDGGEESSYLNFFTLKGATVTQKRG